MLVSYSCHFNSWDSTHRTHSGQTEARGGQTNFDLVGDSADGSSFLDRERAALGDDAAQFATPGDNIATVEDAGDDDLLGGGGDFVQADGVSQQDISGFESSFPAIDTSNEVSVHALTFQGAH